MPSASRLVVAQPSASATFAEQGFNTREGMFSEAGTCHAMGQPLHGFYPGASLHGVPATAEMSVATTLT